MDLLGGYGSDASSEDDDTPTTVQVKNNSTEAPRPSGNSLPAPGATRPTSSSFKSQEGSGIAGTSGALWSSLPKASSTKRVVQFQAPINKALLASADSDEEEAEARRAKRARISGAKSSLKDFLPPPKNQAAGGGSRIALGAGKAASQSKKKAHADSDDDDEDAMGRMGPMEGVGNFAAGPAADADDDDFPTSGVGCAEVSAMRQQQQQEAQYAAQQYYQGGDAGYYSEQQQQQQYYGADAQQQYYYQHGSSSQQAYAQGHAPQPSSDPLMAALVQEQGKSKKGSEAQLLAGMQFKEIDGKSLSYMDPAQREALGGGVRNALGADFAAQLRGQAKGHEGSKMARRKHQIGTLFFNAKMKELEILEGKATSMKHKSETQAKYGW